VFNIEAIRRSEEEIEANESRPNPQRYEHCVCCGRALKPATAVEIEVGGGGWDLIDQSPNAAEQAQTMRNDGGHMGFWVVGPYCAKKIPVRYHVKESSK
jgi:hypothetical protein